MADLADSGTADFRPIYGDALPLFDKIETVVKRIYRGAEVTAPQAVRDQLAAWEEAGYGICPSAWRRRSIPSPPIRRFAARRSGFPVHVREVRLSAGAGFVVAICGEIMTMPGLPSKPAAESIRLNADGEIEGLF